MVLDTIVIDSFDLPVDSNDTVNKAIADKLAELKISAKAVFSITTFKAIGHASYTIWYKKCERCKNGCNHHE